MLRKILAIGSAVVLSVGLASCSTGTPAGAPGADGPGATATQVATKTVLLDVRSPEEFAAGHLEGAVLLDFNSGEFAQALPTLDPDTEYQLYCRSGNRAGQAITMMEQAGLNGTNLGSLEDAARQTGAPIVKP